MSPVFRISLKVDVCTREGLDRGVPALLDLFSACDVAATFFVTTGPDRSGLAALKLWRPRFFLKMLRTRALNLYGLRTALSGTLLPARKTAPARQDLLARIRAEGHELGLHGWDHRLWQDRIDHLPEPLVEEQLERAFNTFQKLVGEPPTAFAAPAWTASTLALRLLNRRKLDYTSNSRGGRPFFPSLASEALDTLEIPTTLACPEEILSSRPGAEPYSRSFLPLLETDLNVFPAHAEFEGSPRHLESFRRWITSCLDRGARFLTMSQAAQEILSSTDPPPARAYCRKTLPGRDGEVLTGWPEG